MNRRLNLRLEIGKFSTARWVEAPYSAPLGTRTSPIESLSIRYPTLILLDRPAGPRLRMGECTLQLPIGFDSFVSGAVHGNRFLDGVDSNHGELGKRRCGRRK